MSKLMQDIIGTQTQVVTVSVYPEQLLSGLGKVFGISDSVAAVDGKLGEYIDVGGHTTDYKFYEFGEQSESQFRAYTCLRELKELLKGLE